MQASVAHSAPTAVIADDERLMRVQISARLKEAWPDLVIVGEAGNGRDFGLGELNRMSSSTSTCPRWTTGAWALAGQARGIVTAYDQYAITAFEQGAIDYLPGRRSRNG
jgi:DNA-binding LytR/AlgR family response regulator